MPTKNQYGGGLKFSSQETCGSRQRLSTVRTSYYVLYLKNKDFSRAYEKEILGKNVNDDKLDLFPALRNIIRGGKLVGSQELSNPKKWDIQISLYPSKSRSWKKRQICPSGYWRKKRREKTLLFERNKKLGRFSESKTRASLAINSISQKQRFFKWL